MKLQTNSTDTTILLIHSIDVLVITYVYMLNHQITVHAKRLYDNFSNVRTMLKEWRPYQEIAIFIKYIQQQIKLLLSTNNISTIRNLLIASQMPITCL